MDAVVKAPNIAGLGVPVKVGAQVTSGGQENVKQKGATTETLRHGAISVSLISFHLHTECCVHLAQGVAPYAKCTQRLVGREHVRRNLSVPPCLRGEVFLGCGNSPHWQEKDKEK